MSNPNSKRRAWEHELGWEMVSERDLQWIEVLTEVLPASGLSCTNRLIIWRILARRFFLMRDTSKSKLFSYDGNLTVMPNEKTSASLPPLIPVHSGPTLGNSLAYMGSLVSFLAENSQTGGRFSIMWGIARRGNEPPPHVHAREHEIYYMLEGGKSSSSAKASRKAFWRELAR